MLLFVIAAVWVAFGAAAAAVMHRRGHDTYAWAVVFVVLGPLALPMAIAADRHLPAAPDVPPHHGELEVLAVHDGSPDADAALDAALAILGDRVTGLTIACVVDAEAATTVRGRETQRDAHERLDAVARRLGATTSATIDTVVLFGEPGRAVQTFADEHGYTLIVAACCRASQRLVKATPVPVLVGPA